MIPLSSSFGSIPWDSLDDSLVARYDVPGPRYTSYPTAPQWRPDFQGAEAALERAGEDGDSPLSLYVHLPFCESMCAFCGCNVVLARDRQRADKYLDYLEKEVALLVDLLGTRRRRLTQVHWGGGTPTFLLPRQMERLGEVLRRHFTVAEDAELAIEANPRITTVEHLATLAGLGWNRLSVGVQDLDPQVQQAIRRVQDVESIAHLLREARERGFRGINVDLVYGLPGQTTDTFRRTLERVVESLNPDRLAVYSFAFVPELRPHQRLLPAGSIPWGLPRLRLLEQAHQVLGGAGYVPIGMDHFARPEDPLAQAAEMGTLGRNFQGYTVKAAPETVGLGITGISEVGGCYFQNHRSMNRYQEALDRGTLPVDRGLRLQEEDKRRKALITDILCRFQADLGDGPYGEEWEVATEADPALTDLAGMEGSVLTLSPLGHLFSRNVAMVFDAWLPRGERPGKGSFSRTV